MRNTLDRLFATAAPRAVILVRIAIAFVFVLEGLQKFSIPAPSASGASTSPRQPRASRAAREPGR